MHVCVCVCVCACVCVCVCACAIEDSVHCPTVYDYCTLVGVAGGLGISVLI